MRAIALFATLAGLPAAAAQPRAVEPDAAAPAPAATPSAIPQPVARPLMTPRRPPHPPPGLGASLAFGCASGDLGACEGWVARLDYDVLPVMAPTGTPGPLFGFSPGIEYWRDAPNWGLAMPLAIVIGVRALPVRAQLGIGLHALTIDRVNGDTGVGLWSPLATAAAGLDIHGFRLGVDARISRHWQFGAPDFTQYQLVVFAGRTIEPKRPVY